ncbi:MAG: hypothetical protein ACTHN5_13685, partial [Phycisphaerae bacterium]
PFRTRSLRSPVLQGPGGGIACGGFYRREVTRALEDGSLYESDSNKVVQFYNRAVIGYTGCARIGALVTDYWIASQVEEIGREELERVPELLRKRATLAFKHLKRPHSFVIAGWAGSPENSAPQIWIVSNYENGMGNINSPSTEFSTNTICGKGELDIVRTGAKLSSRIQAKMDKTTRQLNKRDVLTNPDNVLRWFVKTIQETSKINSSVGADLLAVLLPREGAFQPYSSGISLGATGPMIAGGARFGTAEYKQLQDSTAQLETIGPVFLHLTTAEPWRPKYYMPMMVQERLTMKVVDAYPGVMTREEFLKMCEKYNPFRR